MPNYLIMKRTGEGELDLKPCAVIRGKTADEVDDAITEGATAGEGPYVALSMSTAVERDLRMKPELSAPAE
jgi:hypothetical protein